MSARKSKTAKELLKDARLPEKSVAICLNGDLAAEVEELERQLEAEQEKPRRLAENPGVVTAKRIEALREQMREATISLRLRAMKRVDWRTQAREHPPREGDGVDEGVGVNVDTFFPLAIRASIVDPVLDDEDWDNLSDGLSEGDWDKLVTAVWLLNKGGVDIPFSRLASTVMRESAGGSKQQPASA